MWRNGFHRARVSRTLCTPGETAGKDTAAARSEALIRGHRPHGGPPCTLDHPAKVIGVEVARHHLGRPSDPALAELRYLVAGKRFGKRERDDAKQLKADGARAEDIEAVLARAKEIEGKGAEAQADGDAAYWPVFNLDRKNPRALVATEHRTPEALVDLILAKERRIVELMEEVRSALGAGWA